jgi:universal stress protein A
MTIVCPTDFSEPAAQAQAAALRLARALGGEVVFVHVAVETPLYGEGIGKLDLPKIYDHQRAWAANALRDRVTAASQEGVPARFLVRVGVPHEQIVKAARDEAADYIVIGTHGRTGLNRLLLGSVAERVIRLAPCPVLAVREKA